MGCHLVYLNICIVFTITVAWHNGDPWRSSFSKVDIGYDVLLKLKIIFTQAGMEWALGLSKMLSVLKRSNKAINVNILHFVVQ